MSSAVPPCYADLGKTARELFSKGFNYGFYKLEAKTKTKSGAEFNTTSSSNHDSGKFYGNLEAKYKWTEYGLVLTERWNTDNSLGTELSIEDQLLKGLKLSFDTSFAPHTGKKSGKIRSAYKRDYLHTNVDVDFDFAGPTIHSAGVLGYQGWLGGAQMVFDTSKSKLSQCNFALGYTTSDFTLHTAVNDGSEFTGSVHQRVNDKVDTGVSLSWTSGTNLTRFSVAAKYCPDLDTTFRAKLSNTGQIGLSYQQKIRSGVTLTLSSLIEGRTFNQGGHKVGVGLECEG
jgi:voltage-dependent anion channel protein 2